LLLAAFVLAQIWAESRRGRPVWQRIPVSLLAAGYAGLALLAAWLSPPSGKAFIYFQF
jgi:hypothetical protein